MCGRYVGKTAVYGAALLGVALFFGLQRLDAQELPDAVVRMIERQSEDGVSDPEALAEYFLDLMRNPLDLGSADREALEAFPLMTPFMVASLLEYRDEYGAPASLAELALVDGFDMARVREMAPFVMVGDNASVREERLRLSGKWTLRSRWKAVRGEAPPEYGLPVPLLSKLKVEVGRHFGLGLTLETDMGEKGFPDFYSMYLSASDLSLSRDGKFRLSSAVIGDYSLRFGQGLVLWNSFSMSGLSDPSSVVRREAGVRPYSSTDENNYFHGAGVSLELPWNLALSLFYSNNGQDARLEDGFFVTKPDDGLHDSAADRAARDALREEVVGGNVSWRNAWLKVGTTVAAYRYDHRDGRRESYYNAHQRYNGWWGNASVDFLLSLQGVRLFGEAALDKDLDPAVLVGAAWPVFSGLDLALLYRYYSKDYIATHSGGYSRTACNNEHGASLSLRWSPVQDLTLSGSLEYTHYPFSRFGVRGPSNSLKGALDCEFSPAEGHTLYFKVSGTYDDGRDTRLLRLRAEYSFSMDNGLELSTRLEGSHGGGFGGLLYQEAAYRSPSGKFRGSLRATLFYAPDWDSRIYCYEGDVPGAFSVPAYYGKGAGLYVMLTYKPVRWFNLSIKLSASDYSGLEKDGLGARLQITVPF